MLEAVWIVFAFVLGIGVKMVGLPPLIGYLAAGFAIVGAGQVAGIPVEGTEVLEHIAHPAGHARKHGISTCKNDIFEDVDTNILWTGEYCTQHHARNGLPTITEEYGLWSSSCLSRN